MGVHPLLTHKEKLIVAAVHTHINTYILVIVAHEKH